MEQLFRHPIILLFVAFMLMSLAGWIGAVILRTRFPISGESRDDFKLVQSATLTLLALVIGFSLSMAVNRYDQRKNYEEEEANAIGTEFVRADLLPAGAATQIRTDLALYLDLRIQFYQTRDEQGIKQINAATANLQDRLWRMAASTAQTQPNPVTALAVAGMNDVLNTQGYTQAAWWNRVPLAAWALLILIGVLANMLVGYGAENTQGKSRLLLIMPVTVSLSFMLIADIDSPRNGIIRVVPQNLISTAQALPKP
ncbi:hypothetical protein E2553_05375 [Paraburkholderia dipogonis]|uniref:DUF4239 domain-containing protein n=2 Tax=Paraburkholderia dipogonis TaxID=1211383 RepID=A0A4Y8NBI4_9BURK|nr:hypothetical protein [Paraburkholderia dipogonis]TFE47170.1 hypothetical protein E2553_05375 [Paraburkholderia dipogonis]